jgi:hypothetical protein
MVKFSEDLDTFDYAGTVDLTLPSPPVISHKIWNRLWGYVTPITEKLATIVIKIEKVTGKILPRTKEVCDYATEESVKISKEIAMITAPSLVIYAINRTYFNFFEDLIAFKALIATGVMITLAVVSNRNNDLAKTSYNNDLAKTSKKKEVPLKKAIKTIENPLLVSDSKWKRIIFKIKAVAYLLLFISFNLWLYMFDETGSKKAIHQKSIKKFN